jgi:hypothetical protein
MQSKEEVQQRMFNFIGQWQQSGVSQKAFCVQVNLAYHVFHYWYKRYRIAGGQTTASSFKKLKVSAPSVCSSMELVLPDGKRLLFHQPVSIDYLKALIS